MKKKIRIYELVVIGGGPAGVAAAIRAKTTLPNVLLIEKKTTGGKVNEISLASDYNNTSPIKGKELTLMMEKQLSESKLSVKKLEVTSLQKKDKLFIIKGQDCFFYSHSVVIATGSNWKELKLEKTEDAHHKSFSYGITSEACSAAQGKTIMIVGGGYSGCQAANFLSKFAEKVYLVHRGWELTINCELKNRILKNDKIEIYLNSIPLKTRGKEKLESCTISINNDFQKKLKVSMIFPCIGTTANSWLVRQIVDCTTTGDIKVDDSFQTNICGLFAAGDVISKNSSQIKAAAIEGDLAAQAAIKYLLGRI